MGSTPIWTVDAFADEALTGNPAAVCVLDGPRTDAWLAGIARELNLSETAFLERRTDGWSLRWFTPTVEVELCGHATLASAHVLREAGLDTGDTISFHTRSGLLQASRDGDELVLDFPAEPASPVAAPAGLLDALGIAVAVAVARNRFDYLVEVDSAAAVRALRPDMTRLAEIETRGVIVTALADGAGHDFVSRWFGPRVGVPEDPVTGSAHCCLAPWWAARLDRRELRGYQASPRGGSVGVRLRGDRVELVGRAVTVLRGELLV
jgi:PhzF family phenazine biosynthesis protein